jgi:hypothetical protein
MRAQIRVVILGALLIYVLNASPAYCQPSLSDTTFLTKANKISVALYTESIQHQSRLFNGSDYIVYLPENDEHPYFKTDDWAFGSVTYWDETYDNVPLLYDLSNDQVIAEHEGGSPIKLVTEKIEGFTILDHTFRRLKQDDKNKISEGFYDELYNGKLKVYAKHTKSFQESIETTKIIPRYDAHTRYYILKDGIYYGVKKKSSILDVFSDRKQDVKDFIRKNRIRFKHHHESAIVQIAEFYDTFNK